MVPEPAWEISAAFLVRRAGTPACPPRSPAAVRAAGPRRRSDRSPTESCDHGLHDTNWYITTNCTGSDHYWCVVDNGQSELRQRFGADRRRINIEEVSAEEMNGPFAAFLS